MAMRRQPFQRQAEMKIVARRTSMPRRFMARFLDQSTRSRKLAQTCVACVVVGDSPARF